MISKTNDYFAAVKRTIWDFILFRGILALVVGIIFIAIPNIAINTLCVLLGIFLLINGLAGLLKAVKMDAGKGLFLIYGFICLAAGVVVLTKPAFLKDLITIAFAIWVLLSGGHQLVKVYKSKHGPILARILTVLVGVISIVFAMAILFHPDIGIRIIVRLTGIYFLVFGVLALTIGIMVRKASKQA